MPRRRKINGNRWIVVFIVGVIISGCLLYASGHWENPLALLGIRIFGARTLPVRQGGSVFISNLLDVLFNVWFICAVTAFVIVVQKTVSFLTARLRNK
jgi:hypothetical protein